MLERIVVSHHSQIAGIAGSWLASGARAFGVWAGGAPLVCWPKDATAGNDWLTALIRVNGAVAGELRVAAAPTRANRLQLQAEAGLIAALATVSSDLTGITSMLVDARDQLLALYRLMQTTGVSPDLSQTVSSLAAEAARLTGACDVRLMVQLPGRQYVTGRFPDERANYDWLLPYVEEMIHCKHPFLDVERDGDNWPANAKSLLLLPLHVQGAPMAAIALFRKDEGPATTAEIKMARALAEYAGLQIDRGIMFQAHVERAKVDMEMELAQNVQTRLASNRPASVNGLDLWATTQPASRIGGDFYDFIHKPGQPFTFTVGDVSGKGVPAALLMAMTRMVLRTLANADPYPTPEGVIGGSNAELYEDFTQVNMIATVFVGQYEPSDRTLLYANAGHSPVVLRTAEGETRLLEADGTAFGVMPTSLSRNQWLKIRPGDVLVVGTDGLSEARDGKGQMFGYNQLLQLVASVADRSAREIGELLCSTVDAFTRGNARDDDRTLVVCKGI